MQKQRVNYSWHSLAQIAKLQEIEISDTSLGRRFIGGREIYLNMHFLKASKR